MEDSKSFTCFFKSILKDLLQKQLTTHLFTHKPFIEPGYTWDFNCLIFPQFTNPTPKLSLSPLKSR